LEPGVVTGRFLELSLPYCQSVEGERSSYSFNAYCRELEPAMQAIASETGISTEVMVTAPPFQHDPNSAAVQLAKALTGQNDTYKVPFVAEAGHFQQAGLPTVVCGPGSIDQAHQPNEYISLQQVEAGTQFLRKLIKRLS
jgi:acetylornithine deacetylase